MEGSEIVLCDTIRANIHYYTCQNPQNSQHQVNPNVNCELSSPHINIVSSIVRRVHHTVHDISDGVWELREFMGILYFLPIFLCKPETVQG